MRGRQLLVTFALVLAALLVLGIAVWWMLFKDTASTRRPVVQPPMLALPPPRRRRHRRRKSHRNRRRRRKKRCQSRNLWIHQRRLKSQRQRRTTPTR